jgi:hypothetical protein
VSLPERRRRGSRTKRSSINSIDYPNNKSSFFLEFL